MRNLGVVFVLLLCLAIVSPEWVNAAGTGSGGGPARIPMSSLKTLYFRDGGKTLARRGRPMKQLNCIGNSKHLCDTYSPDIIMCKSAGDGAWRCEADIHPSVRLGAVEVSCEGWEHPDDEYVLRGSCLLEYNILPAYAGGDNSTSGYSSSRMDSLAGTLFFIAFFGVLGYIVYSFFKSIGSNNRGARGATQGRGWGGFGPGWGGGGGGGDAPPPYHPYPKPNTDASSSSSAWRPGFWTGLGLGGIAAQATNTLLDRQRRDTSNNWARGPTRRTTFFGGDDDDDQPVFRQAAAGPSRSRPTSSETRTSMGFGGTRNR